MIALNFTDPVATQLGSIGYPCRPVLMILNRMKGLCGILVFSSRLVPASSCRVPALDVGLKNDSMNDRSTSPLKEQVFGVIHLVPLFTVSFKYYTFVLHSLLQHMYYLQSSSTCIILIMNASTLVLPNRPLY
jgi:hypothetical protein